ncbi:flagellar export protein FliJ [Pelagicoccus sp. SDUM812005]|uniref:flagellar export protein FliJ n=1 Tax=Pelagicoccus sp. SDUM812005 TaxID=3041257 RepID=UPI00280D50C8|nr:flagellar export protein FliJ [Pelagicoccus sp. SDUM812005]MDQ8182345.1 flagellar export protein FliJ [Pelagicoccus sp. SDUM812005]
MKKFSFNLDPLLALRERDEQNARNALSEVNAQVERINQHIAKLEDSVTGTYASWDGQSGRRFSPMDRMGLSHQVADLKRQADEARKLMQKAQERRSKAMQALQEATRNRKIVTNLKEKRFKEYTAEVEKQEATEIEDIYNARRSAI